MIQSFSRKVHFSITFLLTVGCVHLSDQLKPDSKQLVGLLPLTSRRDVRPSAWLRWDNANVSRSTENDRVFWGAFSVISYLTRNLICRQLSFTLKSLGYPLLFVLYISAWDILSLMMSASQEILVQTASCRALA